MKLKVGRSRESALAGAAGARSASGESGGFSCLALAKLFHATFVRFATKQGFLTGAYGLRGWFFCVPINAIRGYISERSGIAGRRCADGDLGRRRFEAMRITPPIQAIERTGVRIGRGSLRLRGGFRFISPVAHLCRWAETVRSSREPCQRR